MDPRFRLLIQQQKSSSTSAVINNNVNASQFNGSGIKNSITQQALTQQSSRPYEIIQQQQQQQLHQHQQQSPQTFSGINFILIIMISDYLYMLYY